MLHGKLCPECGYYHSSERCAVCKSAHADRQNCNYDKFVNFNIISRNISRARKKYEKAKDSYYSFSEYDPYSMMSNGGYDPNQIGFGLSQETESDVDKCMSKYKKSIYNPKTGEVKMWMTTPTCYRINDIIKFSNRDLVSEKIAGKKFLITQYVEEKISMMSIDEEETALCLDKSTILDLGGAIVGYRREKPVGFWAWIKRVPQYEFVSLRDKQVQK